MYTGVPDNLLDIRLTDAYNGPQIDDDFISLTFEITALSREDIDSVKELFTGFGGGMGCGITCGALSGAIGALSGKYRGMDRETCHELCTAFVEKFKEKIACGSVDCSVIAAKYKVPETRCLAAVLLAAEALEEFVKEWEEK